MSEPTTGEIVRALRCSADDDSFCKKCQYGYALAHAFLCDHGRMNGNAADRLESQEREIEELKAEAIVNALENSERIANITARAEQAERDSDDAEKVLARRIMKHLSDNEFDSTDVCEICEYNLINSPKCLSCGSDHHYGENFELKHTLRGQPQEGEGL